MSQSGIFIGATGGIATDFISLPATTALNVGTIQINGIQFLHAFGTDNTFVGSNSGNFTATGTENSAFGKDALSLLSTGIKNIAIGTEAMENTTTGDANLAIGVRALFANETASVNIAIGESCLSALTSGVDNVAIGPITLGTIVSGNRNTVVGRNSMSIATGGSDNTTLGYNAVMSLVSGDSNIVIGSSAGTLLTTNDSSNIIIGHVGIAGLNNTIVIGNPGAGAAQQNVCFIHAITGSTVGGTNNTVLIDNTGRLGTISSSRRYKEDIVDLSDEYCSKIENLRPVTFVMKKDKDKAKRFGLIAEEATEVFPDLVNLDAEGLPESVRYYDFIPIILKEIQKINKRLTALESLSP